MAQIFHRGANNIAKASIAVAVVLAAVAGYAYTQIARSSYLTNRYLERQQPVQFSHKHHVGDDGIDCRYCHAGVEKSGTSSVPAAQTCMNCHSTIKTQSPLLEVVRQSYQTGDPVPWVKIHAVPDYVYFNHSVHVNRGVSCVECHGKVNEMKVVHQDQPHSMSWCLDCHRNPAARIRLPEDVYNLDSKRVIDQGPDGAKNAQALVDHWKLMPPTSCSGCHR